MRFAAWADAMLHKLLSGRCWCPAICEWISWQEAKREIVRGGRRG